MKTGTVPIPFIARRAAVGTGWIIAWRMVSRNLGLLSTLVLVRLLNPGDFGLVSLANGLIASEAPRRAVMTWVAIATQP